MNIINTIFAEAVSHNNVETSNIGAAGALFIFLLFSLIFAVAVAVFVFWVLALIHLIQHEDVKDRVLWIVLLFIVGGIIGPVYYFAVKKPYDKLNSRPKPSKKQ